MPKSPKSPASPKSPTSPKSLTSPKSPASPKSASSGQSARVVPEVTGRIDAAPDLHDEGADGDSCYSDGSSFSTGSLNESIFNYRKFHGRTFNAQSTSYWAPNDAQQNEGLDLMYNALCMTMNNKLFYAPITEEEANNGLKVLDLGTGLGQWPIDFADQFPGSEVVGTDLSPIQPSWVPPNVRFQIDDFLLDWTWPDCHFDFVHARTIYGSVTDYYELYQKAFAHLKPGGWFEELELDVHIQSDHVANLPGIFSEWAELFYEVGEKSGKTFTIGKSHEMRDSMIKAGFVDVVEHRIKLPIGGWPRDPTLQQAGLLALGALDSSLEGYALWGFVNYLGWSPEQVVLYAARYRNECKKKTNCGYLLTTIVHGRKPEAAA